MDTQLLLDNFAAVANAPSGVERLRGFVLDLAVGGRLAEQDSGDQSAARLVADCANEVIANAPNKRRSRRGDTAGGALEKERVSLPTSWSWAKASDLGYLTRGVSYKKADATDSPADGTVPLLRAHNIDGSINYDKLVHVPSELVSEAQYLVPGDQLICMSSGSSRLVGKSAMVAEGGTATFGAFCSAFRPAVYSIADYLAVFLASPLYRRQVTSLSRGIGINNLRAGDIENLDVPLPPIAEQRRIVSKVDELMRLCDDLETALQRQYKLQADTASVLTDTSGLWSSGAV